MVLKIVYIFTEILKEKERSDFIEQGEITRRVRMGTTIPKGRGLTRDHQTTGGGCRQAKEQVRRPNSHSMREGRYHRYF
jgi:hypothetical protein